MVAECQDSQFLCGHRRWQYLWSDYIVRIDDDKGYSKPHSNADKQITSNNRNPVRLFGDSVNVMLAAAAFNLKRVLRALLALIQRWMILFLDWLEGFIEGSDRLTCTRV